jgi:hypothetical protein
MNDDAWKPKPVQADDASGRWPPNLLLSHSAECVRVGERSVGRGNGKQDERGKRPRGMGEVGERKGDPRPNGPTYGTETVPAYACAADCPVALMDRQSGSLRARGNVTPTKRDPRTSMFGVGGAPGEIDAGDSRVASRFFPTFDADPFLYQAKASKRDRGDGNRHPTVKPLALMRWLVRLVTPPGGLVLDPFAGSGTTLVAAMAEGMDAIGIEREAEYVEIIKARIAKAQPAIPLDGAAE